MIEKHGLFYYYMINRLNNLEKKDKELMLKFISIVNRYENKYNKNIFYISK